MIENASFNFSERITEAREQNATPLRCEEKIRSLILSSDYDSSLLLRSVAHQLMIYVSSYIIRHDNMLHGASNEGFPYLPGAD